jgi:hypothetical protein
MTEEIDALFDIEDRRELRRKLKTTLDRLHENRTEMANVNSNKFRLLSQELRETSLQVDHTRELTLDAVGLKDLSMVVKAQASSLRQFASRLDFDLLLQTLHTTFEGSRTHTMNFESLGMAVGMVFDTIPMMSTMCGAIKKEIKTRKVAIRKVQNKDDGVEMVIPQNLIQDEEEEMDEATNKRVENMLKVCCREGLIGYLVSHA